MIFCIRDNSGIKIMKYAESNYRTVNMHSQYVFFISNFSTIINVTVIYNLLHTINTVCMIFYF